MDQHDEIKRRLMDTFQVELDEYLDILSKGIMALEDDPPEQDREAWLAEMFRVAHSLKGAARAVDLDDIKIVAHRLEDILHALRNGTLSLTAEVGDLLFLVVDFLRAIMNTHLLGQKLPDKDLKLLLCGLEAALTGESPTLPSKPEFEPSSPPPATMETSAASPRPAVDPAPPPSPPLGTGQASVRVTTDKLDALMATSGELLVARLRTEQRLRELQDIRRQVGQWQKSRQRISGTFNRMRRKSSWDADISSMLEFMARNDDFLNALSFGVDDALKLMAGDHRNLALLSDDLQNGVHRVRMVPIATLFDQFPRMVRDLARERGKELTLEIEGAETEVDRQLLETLKDPLAHLLRNAVDHGIEPPNKRQEIGKPGPGSIRLSAAQKGGSIVIEIADDGRGIDLETVAEQAVARGLVSEQEISSLSRRETLDLIFRPGLSTATRTTDLSGRGVGLDVVRQNLEPLHGMVEADTTPARGTVFTLTMPLTLAFSHVLLVEVAGQTVALPTTAVERILRVDASGVNSIEGKPTVHIGGRTLPLIRLAEVLELARGDHTPAAWQGLTVVVLGVAERRIACWVDRVQGTQEVVIKSLGRQLKRVRNVAGATILGTGRVVIIINVTDLVKSAKSGRVATGAPLVKLQDVTRHRVLVVDDSITTRTLEKNILENAGFDVLTAADGQAAWALIQDQPLDVVVADVAMPRMDGFTLTEMVKESEQFKETPVILVTSLESAQDKMRGMEAGADAYITKSSFDQRELLETIDRLIG